MDKPLRVVLNHAQLNAAPTGEQLTNPAARIVDPVLSTGARGYKNAMFVYDALFPHVPCSARGGNRIEFDRTDFRRVRSRRAPGADTQEVMFGHEGKKFALNQYRLMGKQPLETAQDAMMVAGIDLNMRTVNGTQDLIALEKEIDAAALATASASYDASNVMTPGAGQRWDADGSSPTDQVMEAVEVIRQKTAMRPNVVLMGGKVYSKVRVHEEALRSIRYKDADGGKKIAGKDDLAALWDVDQVVVGDAIYVDEDDAATDVWGNHVVIAFTRVGSVSMYLPSFGYTYQLAGTPLVEEPYFERKKNSWLYPVCDEYSSEIVGKDAGYLIRNAIV